MNGEEKKFITIKEASTISGLDKQTIRKMFDLSQIHGYKTPSGQRKIDRSSIQTMCLGDVYDEKKQSIQRQNFLYIRVSTKKQMDDLSRQVEYIQQPEYAEYTLVSDISSGINFKRKGLQRILDCCIQRTIGEVVVAHRDRLCRFAFELIESIIQKAGGSIKVLDTDNHTSTEEELSQDLLSIIHIFNCRQMGKRSYKIKNRRRGIEEVSENNKDKIVSNSATKTSS